MKFVKGIFATYKQHGLLLTQIEFGSVLEETYTKLCLPLQSVSTHELTQTNPDKIFMLHKMCLDLNFNKLPRKHAWPLPLL